MLATNEGVPLPLQWCSGAAVLYAMVLWSNQKRRVVAPCKGRVSRFPWAKVPLIGPEHSILHYSPFISTAGGYRRTCGFPTKLDPTSSVSELHSTSRRPTEIDGAGDLPS